jgi:hypothetical protein
MKTDNFLSWIDRAGDRLAGLSDAAAAALGTWWRSWLRLFAYAMAGLVAGAVVGDPYRIGGIVLGCAVIVELGIALLNWFVDPREILVKLAIEFWWQFRHQEWAVDVLAKGLPLDDKDRAREMLWEKVKRGDW